MVYLITSDNETTHRIWRIDKGLDDLLSRACNHLQPHFRANSGFKEQAGICLEM